jgi:hypothetical protein
MADIRDTSSLGYYNVFPGSIRLTYDVATAQPLVIAPSAVSASTGISPRETSYSIWGNTIPLYVFGVGRIGGELISGPWHESGLASFGISYGFPADPAGTRTLEEIAFDSEVVWTLAGGFTTEPFTFRWYGGTLSQAVDPLETLHFGAEANAYRPQTMLFIENLPLANTKFNSIPYVACKFSDSSGDDVNLGEALERIAYGPFGGYTSDEFETIGITDGLPEGGLIIAQTTEFLQLLQNFGRFYSNWDILQTDKLRIVDRGSDVTADITLDRTRLMEKLSVSLQGADTVNKDIELSTIDPAADYTIVPFVATRPRDPVPVTTSVRRDTAYLPVIMDSFTRAAITTLALYREQATRKRISGTAMAYGLEMEPGDLVAITDIGDNFRDEIFKVEETLHGVNNAVEFTAVSIFNCETPPGVCVNSGHAAAFLARTTGLDATHIAAYTALLDGLDADELSCKLDVLHIYATQDSDTALLNLIQNKYNGTIHGSPSFTADSGFAGVDVSSSVYIDTGFNPVTATSPNYQQDTAHMSAWQVDNVNSDGPALGSANATTVFDDFSDAAFMMTRGTGANYSVFRLNQQLNQSLWGPFISDPRGHWLMSRESGANGWLYLDGVVGLGFTGSSGIPNRKMYSLGGNFNGAAIGSAGRLAMISIGGGLSATDAANLYSHVRTYMTAVGVP